jgi:hypothetical protein
MQDVLGDATAADLAAAWRLAFAVCGERTGADAAAEAAVAAQVSWLGPPSPIELLSATYREAEPLGLAAPTAGSADPLLDAWWSLPMDQRAALWLHVADKRSSTVAAAILSLAPGAVTSLADAAQDRLVPGAASAACPGRAELTAYVNGVLAAGKTTDIHKHLTKCRSCTERRALVERLQSLGDPESGPVPVATDAGRLALDKYLLAGAGPWDGGMFDGARVNDRGPAPSKHVTRPTPALPPSPSAPSAAAAPPDPDPPPLLGISDQQMPNGSVANAALAAFRAALETDDPILSSRVPRAPRSATARSATPRSATAKSATAKSATAKSGTGSRTSRSAAARSATSRSRTSKPFVAGPHPTLIESHPPEHEPVPAEPLTAEAETASSQGIAPEPAEAPDAEAETAPGGEVDEATPTEVAAEAPGKARGLGRLRRRRTEMASAIVDEAVLGADAGSWADPRVASDVTDALVPPDAPKPAWPIDDWEPDDAAWRGLGLEDPATAPPAPSTSSPTHEPGPAPAEVQDATPPSGFFPWALEADDEAAPRSEPVGSLTRSGDEEDDEGEGVERRRSDSLELLLRRPGELLRPKVLAVATAGVLAAGIVGAILVHPNGFPRLETVNVRGAGPSLFPGRTANPATVSPPSSSPLIILPPGNTVSALPPGVPSPSDTGTSASSAPPGSPSTTNPASPSSVSQGASPVYGSPTPTGGSSGSPGPTPPTVVPPPGSTTTTKPSPSTTVPPTTLPPTTPPTICILGLICN